MTAVRIRPEGEWPLPGDLVVMRLPAGEPFPPGWNDGWTQDGDPVGTRRVWRVVTEFGEHIRYRHPWTCYVQTAPIDPASTGVPWRPAEPANDASPTTPRDPYASVMAAAQRVAAAPFAVRVDVGQEVYDALAAAAVPQEPIAGVPVATLADLGSTAIVVSADVGPREWRAVDRDGEVIASGTLPRPRYAVRLPDGTVIERHLPIEESE